MGYVEKADAIEDAQWRYSEGKGGKPGTLFLERNANRLVNKYVNMVEGTPSAEPPVGGMVPYRSAIQAAVEMTSEASKKGLTPKQVNKLRDLAYAMIEAANLSSHDGLIIAQASPFRSMSELKGTLTHERAHVAQETLSPTGPVIPRHEIRTIPNIDKITEALEKRGYHGIRFDVPQVLHELLAFSLAGQHRNLGLPEGMLEEALLDVLDKVQKKHGDAGRDMLLKYARPRVRSKAQSAGKSGERLLEGGKGRGEESPSGTEGPPGPPQTRKQSAETGGDASGSEEKRDLVPTFFSRLEESVKRLMPKFSTPEQALAIVRNPQYASQEEVKWSGVEDYIREQKGKISKEDLQQFLSTNKLEVKEVQPVVQYRNWALPGHENYREMIFKIPAFPGMADSPAKRAVSDSPFESSHYANHDNVFAHVRFDDRVDSSGKKVLFLEEMQSDWANEAKKKGFFSLKEQLRLKEEWLNLEHAYRNETQYSKIPNIQQLNAARYAYDQYRQNRIMPFPFAKNWHEFVGKRMLRWAAENGYDRLGWTTGDTQADRFGLDKAVSHIGHAPVEGGKTELYIASKTDAGSNLHDQIVARVPGASIGRDGYVVVVPNQALPDIFGREVAEKIINGEGKKAEKLGLRILAGDDLKIKATGKRSFYDQQLPQFFSKYGKKWDAKTGQDEVSFSENKVSKVSGGEGVTTLDFLGRVRGRLNGMTGNTTQGMEEAGYGVLSTLEASAEWAVDLERGDTPAADLIKKLLSSDAIRESESFKQYINVVKEFGFDVTFDEKKEKIHTIDITPQMKKEVLHRGQPMAMREPPATRKEAVA